MLKEPKDKTLEGLSKLASRRGVIVNNYKISLQLLF